MTLLLNYRPVIQRPTGIGVYANAVLPYLQGLAHVLIPGGQSGGVPDRLMRLLWTQARLRSTAQQQKASLIFTPAPEGYLGRQDCPQVMMVHDLRPLSHPEGSLQSWYFHYWVPELLRNSFHIITNSNYTAQEIVSRVGVRHEQLTVIPLGLDQQRFKPLLSSGPLVPGRYLLHVGQAYPHKNIERLLRAFALIAAQDPTLQLLLAGKPHPTETRRHRKLVAELGIGTQVQFRAYVPDDQLPDLYRGALALVYPSLWEGFGLPVLEAMACGIPVITSLGTGTQEVAGDAAVLIDPLDVEALAEAMWALVVDHGLWQSYRDRGLLRSGMFSWERTGLATQTLMSQLLGAVGML